MDHYVRLAKEFKVVFVLIQKLQIKRGRYRVLVNQFF